MKISSSPSNAPLSGITGAPRPESGQPGGARPGAGGTSVSVDLSPAARHLAAAQDGADDIQAQRVREIRDALAAGRLRMDPGRIADGLLASVRDLLGDPR